MGTVFKISEMKQDLSRSIWDHSVFKLPEKHLGCEHLLVIHSLEENCELILGDFDSNGIFEGKYFDQHAVQDFDKEEFVSTEEFLEI